MPDTFAESESSPVVAVGRVPLLPVHVTRTLYTAFDPLDAARDYLARTPLAMQALYVASPPLSRAAAAWLAGKKARNAKAPLRILAYLLRMAARPTPMGLCAGVGVVAFGDETTLTLEPLAAARTRSRPDMARLLDIVSRVEQASSTHALLTVYTNEMVIERDRLFVMNPDRTRLVGPNASYVEYAPTSLRVTPAVRRARELARGGCTIKELCEGLAAEFSIGAERAQRLVDNLLRGGVILSGLRPSLTGDPVARLAEQLGRVAPHEAAKFARATEAIAELDAAPLTARTVEDYRSAAAPLDGDEDGVMLHVDASFGFTGGLGADVLRDIQRFASYMLRCARRFSLDEYRQRFFARYESGERLVPLVELVDPDAGIGPPGDLAADPEKGGDAARHGRLVNLAARAIAEGALEVEITDDELDGLLGSAPAGGEALATFEIGVHIAARSRAAVNSGNFLICPGGLVGTHGAGKSVGRFADLIGGEVATRLRVALDCSIDGSMVPADLVYIPHDARASNVAIRPPNADFEVQVGLHVDCAPRTRLDPSDLYVGLDGRRFAVYSRRLEKEIDVREFHLLNTPRSAPNACRLLAAIPYDGKRAIVGFDWGRAAILPFLPRLRVGRIVLAPARWLLDAEIVRGTAATAASALDAWRRNGRVPRYVALVRDDHRLPIDLESSIGIEMLLDQAEPADKPSVVVEEMLPSIDDCWLERAGESRAVYAAEFLISFASKCRKTHSAARRLSFPGDDARRRSPASDWLFLKLYCGPNRMDFLLRDALAPYVASLRDDGRIDAWFFVRYADDGPHIRLRMHRRSGPGALAADDLLQAADRWMRDGVVDRVALDTYDREIERYGGEAAMRVAERIFALDSELVIKALSNRPASTKQRIVDCTTTSDLLIRALIASDDMDGWLAATRPASPKLTTGQWNTVKVIRRAIAESRTRPLEEAWDCAGRDLRKLAASGALEVALEALTQSVLHMHCNRFGLDGDAEEDTQKITWHCHYGLKHAIAPNA